MIQFTRIEHHFQAEPSIYFDVDGTGMYQLPGYARDRARDPVGYEAVHLKAGSWRGMDVGLLAAPTAICYPCRMKVNEILARLNTDGWYLVATRGSHRQFKHPVKSGRVTVPGKPSDDLAPGTLNSILKQAQLKD